MNKDQEKKIINEEESKLKIYSCISNNVYTEYFVGHEISFLLGYKNPVNTLQNVSECNKLIFREFSGEKTPALDPRTILITHDGVSEIFLKTLKNIPLDVLNIFHKFNIDTTNIKKLPRNTLETIPNSDIIYDEENELTIYSYISNHLCFEYFIGYEIATLLGYKNITQNITNNVSKCNQLVFRDYPGVKYPELDPKTILVTRDGVVEILLKTRKRLSPDILHIFKKFHIDTTNRKCLTKEQQTLSALTNAFKNEKFEDQYKVDEYYLDLYFSEYKIIVECDENGHADRKPHKERDRMDYVNETLNIDDTNWIRYNPDEKDFDISKVIGKIYMKINLCKEQQYRLLEEEKERQYRLLEEEKEQQYKLFEEEKERQYKLLEEEKERLEKEKNDIQDQIEHSKEEPLWELQIEPITGKFTAPPKEYLLEKLKTHNISDIAKSYGISTNPISKWLKQYEINVKDFHNYDAPGKDELIDLCKEKTQTEVAKHYGVSNHIVRKWLTGYGLDFVSIKMDTKQVSKEELLKLVSEFSETQIAHKLNMTVLNLRKLMKTHNIDEIPSKEELEGHLQTKTKEEIAKLYKTTRTTLRKWLRSYNLADIRCNSMYRPVLAITEDTLVCKDLHIGHSKVYEYAESGEFYKGYKFVFEDVNET